MSSNVWIFQKISGGRGVCNFRGGNSPPPGNMSGINTAVFKGPTSKGRERKWGGEKKGEKRGRGREGMEGKGGDGKEKEGREGRQGNGSMHPLGFSKVGAYGRTTEQQ